MNSLEQLSSNFNLPPFKQDKTNIKYKILQARASNLLL
jgi:hypothetical protein